MRFPSGLGADGPCNSFTGWNRTFIVEAFVNRTLLIRKQETLQKPSMKKTILSVTMLVGLTATMYGQSVFFETVSGGGKIYRSYPNGVLLANDVIAATLWGGPVGGSLTPIITLAHGALLNLGDGVIYDPSGLSYSIPGVAANGQAQLRVQFWIGSSYDSYFQALAAGAPVTDTGVFSNPTGGGGLPPKIPPGLIGLPAVFFIPEPSTLALAVLGLAAVLLFRRCN